MSDVKLSWITVDDTTFSAETQQAIAAYREAAKVAANLRVQAASAARAEVEEAIEVPAGGEVQVGFNFGRTAFAIAPKSAPKTAKGAFKLPTKVKTSAKADAKSLGFALKK